MKILYVLRHAKAERDSPTGGDYDRPLAPRGRDDAARLGQIMNKGPTPRPDMIVTSSAQRTMETVAQLTAHWSKPPQIQADDKLYLAPAARLMETVRHLADTAHSALLVGHNPGIEDFAVQLAGKAPADALTRMRGKFPTCALASFEIAADSWSQVGPDLARFVAFVTPKDLANSFDA